MKPCGIYVCNSKFDDTKITVEIIGSSPGTLRSLELSKKEAGKLVSDLASQIEKLGDE